MSRVLLVGQDCSLCGKLKETCTVFNAQTGLSAFSILNYEEIDTLITDLDIKDFTGLTIALQVCTQKPTINVIIYSDIASEKFAQLIEGKQIQWFNKAETSEDQVVEYVHGLQDRTDLNKTQIVVPAMLIPSKEQLDRVKTNVATINI